jgi:hypothetical protein
VNVASCPGQPLPIPLNRPGQADNVRRRRKAAMKAVPSPQYAPGTPAAGGRSEERGWLIGKVGVGGASVFSDVSQECLAGSRLRLRRHLDGGVHAH